MCQLAKVEMRLKQWLQVQDITIQVWLLNKIYVDGTIFNTAQKLNNLRAKEIGWFLSWLEENIIKSILYIYESGSNILNCFQ